MRTYTKYYSRVQGRFISAEPLASNFDDVVIRCCFADRNSDGSIHNIVYKNITVSWNRLLQALDDGILESRRICDKYNID